MRINRNASLRRKVREPHFLTERPDFGTTVQIHADFDGIVGRRAVVVGDAADSGDVWLAVERPNSQPLLIVRPFRNLKGF